MRKILLMLTFLCHYFYADIISASDIYTIENIEIKAESKEGAKNAEQLAIKKAQKIAFLQLMNKIAPAFEEQQVDLIDDTTISNMVEGFNVNNERSSKNIYYAIFSISFNPDYVKNFLTRKNINFDYKAKSSSVITNKFNVFLPVNNLNEWLNIQNSLNKIENITKLQINTIAKNQINLDIYFTNNYEDLKIQLNDKGFEVVNSDLGLELLYGE